MMLSDNLRENAKVIAQMGASARERARAAGGPSYYTDPSLGDGMIKETPDGMHHLIKPVDGDDFVVESFEPRL